MQRAVMPGTDGSGSAVWYDVLYLQMDVASELRFVLTCALQCEMKHDV